MKLKQLRLFTAVVECGGVIKAAQRMHVSQPAVSAGLASLEEELGGALFHRDAARRLTLTAAGRRFYRHALDILARCETARAEFAARGLQPELRIALLDTLPQPLVIELAQLLALRLPDRRLCVWEGSVQRLNGWLGQGRIDLAVSIVDHDDEGRRVLWREPLMAAVSRGHRFAAPGNGAIEILALAEEPFVHRSRCELDALGRAQLRAAGVSLQVVARAERDELAFQLVREGFGITLAPRGLIPADLAALEVRGLAVTRAVGLTWHAGTEPELVETVAQLLTAGKATSEA